MMMSIRERRGKAKKELEPVASHPGPSELAAKSHAFQCQQPCDLTPESFCTTESPYRESNQDSCLIPQRSWRRTSGSILGIQNNATFTGNWISSPSRRVHRSQVRSKQQHGHRLTTHRAEGPTNVFANEA